MILHTGFTQETMQNIDPYDTMIPTDKIKAIEKTAQDRPIVSRDTNYEVRIVLKKVAQSF